MDIRWKIATSVLLCKLCLSVTVCSLVKHRNEIVQTEHTVQVADSEEFESFTHNDNASRTSLLLTRAELAIAEDDYPTAAAAVQAILSKEQNHPRALHLDAIVKVHQGQMALAKQAFQTALKIEPENARLNSDYGYFLYLLHEWEDAEEFLAKAIAFDANLPEAHTNLGLLLARQGRDLSAKEHFKLAGCSDAEISTNLVFAHSLGGHFSIAQLNSE